MGKWIDLIEQMDESGHCINEQKDEIETGSYLYDSVQNETHVAFSIAIDLSHRGRYICMLLSSDICQLVRHISNTKSVESSFSGLICLPLCPPSH